MKQKIIIIEGADRIGKTSLCGTLETHLGIKIYKRPSDGFDFTRLRCGGVGLETCELLSHLRKTGESIIFDRLHLSEYVYGKLDRMYNEWDNICWFDAMESFMQGLDVTLIIGRPVDEGWSSMKHGKSIKMYDELFVKIAEHSRIPKKFEYHWNKFFGTDKEPGEYEKLRELIARDETV